MWMRNLMQYNFNNEWVENMFKSNWNFKDKFNTKNSWNKICLNPAHNFPSMLYIPAGQSHTHTCPGCGKSQTVISPMIFC